MLYLFAWRPHGDEPLYVPPPASRLGTLQKVAGAASGGGLGASGRSMDELLEGDFDPDEWDKQMAEAFNDDYYEVWT